MNNSRVNLWIQNIYENRENIAPGEKTEHRRQQPYQRNEKEERAKAKVNVENIMASNK